MPNPVNAYFGRNTYALLNNCFICGKEYNDSNDWHTFTSVSSETDVWMIMCADCYRKQLVDRRLKNV